MVRFNRRSPTMYDGPVGTVERMPEGIISVCLRGGRNVNELEARELKRCVLTLSPFSHPLVFVDRRRSYSLSFEAQRVIALTDQLGAVAFLVRTRNTWSVVSYNQKSFLSHVPTRAFSERIEAFRWLRSFLPMAVADSDPDREQSDRCEQRRALWGATRFRGSGDAGSI